MTGEEQSAAEHNRFLISLLGRATEEPAPATTDEPPDFDGGAREPSSDEPDPERDHNALMAELARLGGGDELE